MTPSTSRLLSGLAAALSLATAAPLAAQSFAYPSFPAGTPGFAFNGSGAGITGGALRVQSRTGALASSAWYGTALDVGGGFTTDFRYRIGNCGGVSCGDGFAFVVQNAAAGTAALGQAGGYMGVYGPDVGGIANSLAVEFDQYDNGGTFSDPSANHASVQSCGALPNRASCLVGSPATPAFGLAGTHLARIVYTPGTLRLFVDDLLTPLLTANVDLASTLALDGGRAYVGFTAAQFGGFADTDILSWTFQSTATTTTPEPATLALLGAGLVGVGVVARRRVSARS